MAEAREIHLNVKFEDEQPYASEPLSIHLNVDDAPEQAWPPKPLYVYLNPQIMIQKQSNSLLSQDQDSSPADSPLIIRPQVTIYTDGACQGNPGPGAWASILSCKGHTRELKGFIPSSTNNQAELTAIHQALQALNRPCTVQLYTDSQYAIGVLSKGFKRKTNLNLLRQIDELSIQHFITYHFIRGHAGSSGNERADELANLALNQGLSHSSTNSDR
jgi:ribonuclease HI